MREVVRFGLNPKEKHDVKTEKNVVFLTWIESKSDDFAHFSSSGTRGAPLARTTRPAKISLDLIPGSVHPTTFLIRQVHITSPKMRVWKESTLSDSCPTVKTGDCPLAEREVV